MIFTDDATCSKKRLFFDIFRHHLEDLSMPLLKEKVCLPKQLDYSMKTVQIQAIFCRTFLN